jgi:hypothetical protein
MSVIMTGGRRDGTYSTHVNEDGALSPIHPFLLRSKQCAKHLFRGTIGSETGKDDIRSLSDLLQRLGYFVRD